MNDTHATDVPAAESFTANAAIEMPSSSAKKTLAIVANSYTPYRHHFHQRVVREIPELRLVSIFTHELSAGADWNFGAGEEVGAVSFGAGESSGQQSRLGRQWHEWCKGGKIIRWLIDSNVGAIVLNGYNDLARVRILRWAHGVGVPVFIFGDSNIRGDTAGGMKGLLKRQFVPRVLRLATACLSCGSLGREFFIKYGASPDRVYYCPYEPDYDMIRSLPATQIDAALREFGLATHRRRIVYSGRLVDIKRVDLLIDSFAAIAADRPECDLLIIGGGELEQSLKARVPAPLASRVIWTGFIAEQSKISALYRGCDVLVLPSDIEPWALVINEAAAAGMAIIASDAVGAAAELVRDGVNGRVFPRGDLAALAAALRDVTDSATIDRMKAASADVLADWRRRGDPIDGLRRALKDAGAIERDRPSSVVRST